MDALMVVFMFLVAGGSVGAIILFERKREREAKEVLSNIKREAGVANSIALGDYLKSLERVIEAGNIRQAEMLKSFRDESSKYNPDGSYKGLDQKQLDDLMNNEFSKQEQETYKLLMDNGRSFLDIPLSEARSIGLVATPKDEQEKN